MLEPSVRCRLLGRVTLHLFPYYLGLAVLMRWALLEPLGFKLSHLGWPTLAPPFTTYWVLAAAFGLATTFAAVYIIMCALLGLDVLLNKVSTATKESTEGREAPDSLLLLFTVIFDLFLVLGLVVHGLAVTPGVELSCYAGLAFATSVCVSSLPGRSQSRLQTVGLLGGWLVLIWVVGLAWPHRPAFSKLFPLCTLPPDTGSPWLAGTIVATAITIGYTRAYYLLAFGWIAWPRPWPAALHWHPVSWDAACRLPFPGLGALLTKSWQLGAKSGLGAPQLEWLANGAYADLTASMRAASTVAVAAGASSLEAAAAKLRELSIGNGTGVPPRRVLDALMKMAALERARDQAVCPLLAAMTADHLRETRTSLREACREVSDPVVAAELECASSQWSRLAKTQAKAALAVIGGIKANEIFDTHEPLDPKQHAYVERSSVLAELHSWQQGQNRVAILFGPPGAGKSTLLAGLERQFANQEIVRLDIEDFGDETKVTQQITEAARRALARSASAGGRPPAESASTLIEAIDETDTILRRADTSLLVVVNRYDQLDVQPESHACVASAATNAGARRAVSWLFVGEARPTELEDPALAQALGHAALIGIPALSAEEVAKLLITPLAHRTDTPAELRTALTIPEQFWGSAIDTIALKSGGRPSVVQLIAKHALRLACELDWATIDGERIERVFQAVFEYEREALDRLLGAKPLTSSQWRVLGVADAENAVQMLDQTSLQALIKRGLMVPGTTGHTLAVPLLSQWIRVRRRSKRRKRSQLGGGVNERLVPPGSNAPDNRDSNR